MAELAVVGECPGVFRVGMYLNLAVTAWFGRLDKPAAQVLAQVTRTVLERLNGGRGMSVHLVDDRVQLPEPSTREDLVQIMRDSAQFACVSVIVDGRGFWASAFRGFITSVRVLGPRSYRVHEHGSIAEAVAWIPAEAQKLTGVTLDPAVLERALSTAKHWQEQFRRAR